MGLFDPKGRWATEDSGPALKREKALLEKKLAESEEERSRLAKRIAGLEAKCTTEPDGSRRVKLALFGSPLPYGMTGTHYLFRWGNQKWETVEILRTSDWMHIELRGGDLRGRGKDAEAIITMYMKKARYWAFERIAELEDALHKKWESDKDGFD